MAHGLSYTDFEYSNLQLSAETINSGEELTVTVDLKNTGERTGREVVQLYLHDRYASVVRPVKELKGFELLELEPGESRTVVFTIDESLLSFYDRTGKQLVEAGMFDVMVGGSSVDVLGATFELKATGN